MDEKEISMLFASVGKLENSFKNLAQSAKEKSADIRSFAKVLRETENLPTIDPETLRSVARWGPVNPESDVEFKCSKCEGVISTDWDGSEYFEYCPYCGARTGENI